ncbi:hypothetical protein HDV05_001758 [Chytridiales sp. JEL 0842]|nr:hypothetical protein HDV05_001758 [Chytridiales sp. JEL 0842]
MSGSKQSKTNFHRSVLSFEADTPNFLKILQAQQGLSSKDKDEEKEDSRELEDERPQLVLGDNVSESDAKRAIEVLKEDSGVKVIPLDLSTKNGGKDADSKDELGSKDEESQTATTASSKIVAVGAATDKKRRAEAKLEGQRKALKGVKNKKLLSFDVDE